MISKSVPALECAHVDTCLPDYWSGDARAHVSIPVYKRMTLKAIKAAIRSELNEGAVAGNDARTRDDSGDVGDAWYKRAHAAVNRMQPSIKGRRTFFNDLEEQSEDDDYCVYAYFIFTDKE